MSIIVVISLMLISFMVGWKCAGKFWLYIFKDYKNARYRDEYTHDILKFGTREDAEKLLSDLKDMLDEYKIVTVADLCNLAGVEGRFSDGKYGWTNLSKALVQRKKDGYVLELGKPIVIK